MRESKDEMGAWRLTRRDFLRGMGGLLLGLATWGILGKTSFLPRPKNKLGLRGNQFSDFYEVKKK